MATRRRRLRSIPQDSPTSRALLPRPTFRLQKGAFQTTQNGPLNAFISIINPFAGVLNPQKSLVYSSYLGGSGTFTVSGFPVGEQPAGIAIGRGGEICVAGSTASLDFPVTPHAFQLTNNNTTTRLGPMPF